MGQVYALRELDSYVSSNDFVDSIQVYNRDTGSIYSTDSNVISAPPVGSSSEVVSKNKKEK